MVRATAAEGVETLPAGPRAVAVRRLLPSVSGVVGVKLNTPFAPASAVPSKMPLSKMVTVEPASAVPVMVGVASLMRPAGVVITGAPGATLSMVRATAVDGAETLPARSCAVTVKLLAP